MEQADLAQIDSVESRLTVQIADEDLLAALRHVKEAAGKIWSSDRPDIIRAFTGHGLDHSLRVLGWCVGILNGFSLTSREAFVLLAAAYLHDIGMQCDVVRQKAIASKARKFGADFGVSFTAKSADEYSAEEQTAIRRNHHYLSAAWIDHAYRKGTTILGTSIQHVPPGLIADLIDVCLYHSKLPIRGCDLKFSHPKGDRKQLVAALLRLADELDMDRRRASVDSISDLRLSEDNAIYWWLHEKTDVYFMSPGLLVIEVRLRPDDVRKCGKLIWEMVIEKFQEKNSNVLDVLWEGGICVKVHGSSGVIENPYEARLPMNIVTALTLQHGGGTDASPSAGTGNTEVSPEALDSRQTGMSTLASEVVARLPSGSTAEPEELINLYCFSAAYVFNAQTGNVLDNHEANLFYRKRDKQILGLPEQYLVLRTMLCDDFGNVPGWYFLRELDEPPYSAVEYAALNDIGEEVRKGALQFMARFRAEASLDIIRNSLADDKPDVRALGVDLLSRHGTQDDVSLIEARVKDGTIPADVGKKGLMVLNARFDPSSALQALDSTCEAVVGDVLAFMDLACLPETTLVSVLNGNCEAAKLACAQELYRRRSCLEELSRLEEDKNVRLKEVALLARIEANRRMTPTELNKRLEEMMPKSQLGTDWLSLLARRRLVDEESVRRAYWRKRSVATLEARLWWQAGDAQVAYEILATHHYEYFRDRLVPTSRSSLAMV